MKAYGIKPKPPGYVVGSRRPLGVPRMYGARSRRKIPWSQEELSFLEKWWYEKGDIWVACELHRTWEDCRNVALNTLGLRDSEKLLDKEYRRVKALNHDTQMPRL